MNKEDDYSISVGIGELKSSTDPKCTLIAPNLGSCIGLALYAPKIKMASVVHCLLPLSKADPEKAAKNPFLYVDTGVSLALKAFFDKGISKTELQIYVAGGANINDANNTFEIGKRNHTVLRKLLWKNSLLITGEYTGGSNSKTIGLSLASGQAWIRAGGKMVNF